MGGSGIKSPGTEVVRRSFGSGCHLNNFGSLPGWQGRNKSLLYSTTLNTSHLIACIHSLPSPLHPFSLIKRARVVVVEGTWL